MLLNLLFIVLIIIGITLLAYWLIKQISGSSTPPEKTEIQILKERYAKGEISKSEFEKMKKDLM